MNDSQLPPLSAHAHKSPRSLQYKVENRFLGNSAFTSYWIGLRQPTLGSGAWNASNFQWVDGSTVPSLTPSSINFLSSPGYSHWGWNPAGDPEPNNNLGTNQQCVIVQTSTTATQFPFYHYNGTSDTASRETMVNYVLNDTMNLWAWNDQPCNASYGVVCEFTGGCTRAAPRTHTC